MNIVKRMTKMDNRTKSDVWILTIYFLAGLLLGIIIAPTMHCELSISSSAQGTGFVVASLATSEGYVQEGEQLNQTSWTFVLNNTTLLMEDSAFTLLDNGTIVPTDS
jgi:hypothetical protein